MKISFTENVFEKLKKHLCWDGREKMTYLLCHSTSSGGSVKLLPRQFCIPEEKDYVQRSEGYLEVDKKFASRVFNMAVAEQCDVLQAHVHPPGARGRFSQIDAHDEPVFMRHVAENINGIHHASMVFSHDFGELDSWFFDRERQQVVQVEKVTVVGPDRIKIFIPTGNTIEKTVPDRMDRILKAYGLDAVEMLGHLDIGIIGMSGLGSPLAEMLARYGVRSISVCDPDAIEESNLNRLVGCRPTDVGRSKAEFYADYIARINPLVRSFPYAKSFYDHDVQAAFSQVDVIVGCVDSEARMSINRLALANLIPYFDLGAGISRANGKIEFKGGQVVSVIPGRNVCLECSGLFEGLKKRFWSREKKARERAQGYLVDAEDDPATDSPLVADLDFVIAGWGCHQVLSYLWGTGPAETFNLHCDMSKNRLMPAASSSEGCMWCRREELLGMGDKVPHMLPDQDENIDIPAAVIT